MAWSSQRDTESIVMSGGSGRCVPSWQRFWRSWQDFFLAHAVNAVGVWSGSQCASSVIYAHIVHCARDGQQRASNLLIITQSSLWDVECNNVIWQSQDRELEAMFRPCEILVVLVLTILLSLTPVIYCYQLFSWRRIILVVGQYASL